MVFSVHRRTGLPETSHIMWIVFMINVQSSPLFGRAPKDPLPPHYHVWCIHGLRKENCRNTKASCDNHPGPLPLCPDHLLSILYPLGSISYSSSHHCLPWLGIAIWSSQFNALLSLQQKTWFRSVLLDHSTVNRLSGSYNLISLN